MSTKEEKTTSKRDEKLKNIINNLKNKKTGDDAKKSQKIDDDNNEENNANDAAESEKNDPKDLEIEKWRAEATDWKDRCLRQVAMTENMKKAHMNEMEKNKKRANFGFAKDVLEVYDSVYRAQQIINNLLETKIVKDDEESENSNENNDDNNNQTPLNGIKEGMDMTMNIFNSKLDKNKLIRVGAVGEKFDYDLHQAIRTIDSEEHESGHIIQMVRAGYMMEGELLIPALVIVAN